MMLKINWKKVKKKSFNYTAVVLIASFLSILSITYTPLANIFARPLLVTPQIQEADAALVLSAGAYPNGSLTYFSLERVVQAVKLYNDGLAPKIIFSGGISLRNYDIFDSEAMKGLALELGVKEEDIFLETKSKDTYENILESKKIIEENGFEKVLLVTSTIHTYRSLKTAEKLGLELIPASPPSFEEYRIIPIDRFLLFYLASREYLGLGIYKVLGKI